MFKQLDEFSGTIQVKDKTFTVSYSGGQLSIHRMEVTEALGLLEYLTGKQSPLTVSTVSTWTNDTSVVPTVMTTTSDVVYITPHEDPPKPMVAPKKRTEKTEPELVAEDMEKLQQPVPEVVKQVAQEPGDLFDPVMNNVGTLKEFILILADKGLKSEQQFMDAIEQLKDKVDLLKHTKTNLQSRVGRILTTIDGLGA